MSVRPGDFSITALAEKGLLKMYVTSPPIFFQNREEFGTNLGIAFQITDDLLDVTGDINEVGKAVRKDYKRGKATLVSINGIEESLATAANFCHNAIALLNLYGDKADLLCELVRHIIKRRV